MCKLCIALLPFVRLLQSPISVSLIPTTTIEYVVISSISKVRSMLYVRYISVAVVRVHTVHMVVKMIIGRTGDPLIETYYLMLKKLCIGKLCNGNFNEESKSS